MSVNLKQVGGVYFFTYAEHPDFIKIGKAKTFATRFNSFLCGTPFSMEVLLLLPRKKCSFFNDEPSSFVEREYHRKFSHLKHRNEWFAYTEEVRKYIHQKRQELKFEPFIYTPKVTCSPEYNDENN